MFSREFCEILKSTFSPRTPRVISWNFIKTWLATCFYKSIHFFQQNLHLTDQHAKGESYLKSTITTFTKSQTMIWVNIFKNGPSKIYGLLSLEIFWRLSSTYFTWSILYLTHLWLLWILLIINHQTESLFGEFLHLERTITKVLSRQTRKIGLNLTILWKKITFTKKADFIKVIS